jgi:hypothetical protein
MGLAPGCDRTFLFLTKTWKLVSCTTGIFYEDKFHLSELPDHQSLEDDLTFVEDTLESKQEPEPVPNLPPMRAPDPRARHIDVHNEPPQEESKDAAEPLIEQANVQNDAKSGSQAQARRS